MKVLFLSQIVPYPPHGGVLQRGFHILRQLGNHARVHLLAFVHPDVLPTEEALDRSRRELRRFCEEVEYFPLWAKRSAAAHFTALAVSACSSAPFSVIAHRSAAFQRRVSALLDTGKVDIVHVDTIALSPFVAAAPHVASALTHHNVESVLMQRRALVEKRPLARQYLLRECRKLRAYEAAISPRFDVNIVVSPGDAETLAERASGLRVAIVPNGVDVEYFTPGGEETPALIYTGGMNMLANRDAVLHFLDSIWPRILQQVPEVRFIAIGQDPPKELAAAAARDPRIVVTGYVGDIRPYVRQAAVYVVPLRVGGGTRLKVLDAMAMGKALVSTAIGCEGIAVNPGEHLMVADTPDTFAAITVSLLRDVERRRGLGAAARRLVERQYAWPVVTKSLLQAYGDAVQKAKDVA